MNKNAKRKKKAERKINRSSTPLLRERLIGLFHGPAPDWLPGVLRRIVENCWILFGLFSQ